MNWCTCMQGSSCGNQRPSAPFNRPSVPICANLELCQSAPIHGHQRRCAWLVPRTFRASKTESEQSSTSSCSDLSRAEYSTEIESPSGRVGDCVEIDSRRECRPPQLSSRPSAVLSSAKIAEPSA